MRISLGIVNSLLIVFLTLLVTGCNNVVTHTSTNSDASSAQNVSEDLAPLSVRGSSSLYVLGNNVYIADDGMQVVSIANNMSKADESEAILKRLDLFVLEKNPKQLSIKQATINIQGSNFVLVGWSGLKDFSNQLNLVSQVSGDDLVLSAKPEKLGATSYLLISDDNPHNYMIQNDQDRYNPNLFMISKNNYTILKIVRNNALDYGWRLSYPMKDVDYPLNDYMPMSAIPSETNLKLSLPYIGNEPRLAVYQIAFTNKKTQQNQALYDKIAWDYSQWIKEDIVAKFDGKNIEWFAPLMPNASGEYLLTSSNAQKQGLLLVTPAHTRFIERAQAPYGVKITKPGSANFPTEWFPYQVEIETAYDLDFAALDVSLKRILGTGAYEIGWTRHGFIYKIQPGKQYTGNLEVKTIFWQTAQVSLDLSIDRIDPKVISKEILSNETISILPKTWSFQDILVQYQNIASFQVVFSPCELTNKLNFDQNKGQWLENYMFSCSDIQYATDIVTPEFKFWKVYRSTAVLPANFPKTWLFKAMIKTSSGVAQQVHYFVKSDIGLWTKVANDKLHVWGLLFENNSPIVSWEITLSNIYGTVITWVSVQGTKTILDLPKDANGEIKNDILILNLRNGLHSWFVLIHPRGNGELYRETQQKSYRINSYLNPSDVVSSNQNISFWWDDYPLKVYAYTDRWLYKAGDTAFFAGFVRDLRVFDNLTYLKDKKISVDATDPQWNSLYSNSGVILDEFGWFKGSFLLPSSLSLWDIFLRYQLQGDDRAAYTHNIKVEEYQKPSFFTDVSYVQKAEMLNLIISPQYYFWQSLKSYDIKADRSLVGKDICAYCWWWNQDRYYYNFVFNDTISTWGSFMLRNQTAQNLSQQLFSKDILKQKWYQYTLKANLVVKDNTSDETQFITKYIDFLPEVKLGLSGQPYEWLYNDGSKDDRKAYTIDAEIANWVNLISKLSYEVYFRSYDQELQQWVDGNYYFVNGNSYRLIGSWALTAKTNFSLKTSFIDKPWSYLIRVIAEDKHNTIIWEVQKQVEYYEFKQDTDGLLGALPNNYALTVSVPKKTYEEGDKIPVDIAPYQKGARVIMTVERGWRIIDSFEKVLDGSALSIEVKKWYAPNVVINVMELIWADKSKIARKEPRFLVWYAQADISTAMHELNIQLQTDKNDYKPWEQVKLTIITKDSKGNPVTARISVWVLDQSLLALYDAIREPIPYFFNKLGTSVFSYTNMKLLYQSLKAFANNGSKWGGGNGGKASFSIIRDDLEDVAFWRGAIYTTWGKAEVSFTLPENLTTWVVDLIGITKDTRLGTARTSFTVSKDLIVEPNLPAFVTLGDTLKLPIKLIVPSNKVQWNQIIQWSAFIENSSGDKIALGNFSWKPNTKAMISLAVPQIRLHSPFIKLTVQASYWNMNDGTTQIIPLRTEGLVMKDSVWVIGNEWDHVFQIPDHVGWTVSLSLSQFPTNLIDPVAQYLLAYPYGCTEQILSSITPLSLLVELKDTKKFDTDLIRDDKVILAQWTLVIPELLAQGISTVLSRQQSDGSFWRREKSDSANTTQKYLLTTYVYGSLQLLKNAASSQGQVNQSLRAAEDYLRANRTLSNEGFLYYLSQKSQAWISLTKDEKNALNSLKVQSFPYGWLLRYLIAVYEKDNDAIALRKQYATISTNEDQWTEVSLFLNQTTAYALKLQALAKDPTATQGERMEALQSLLGSREKSGLRGRSTQSNVQALRAIAQLSKNRIAKENVQCAVIIAGQEIKLSVGTGAEVLTTKALWGNIASVKWTCDALIMADASISFMPKKLEDLLGADTNVTKMNYTISKPDAAIGELVDVNASRTTSVPGEQVAVEIFIPSTLKFLDTISNKNTPINNGFGFQPQLPFTVSDYHCMPSHWETRFDRLFLYYDNLTASTCDITTQALRAYNGTTTIMPMRIYEMYKWKINGRKVIR